ncbi:tail fiber assembly protein [Enterobacter kobei]|uniref:Tail fiber assembly protein n=2 Tax=Enterobacter kobei TaxID=208224 RepID=A0AA86M6C7_9ENTR|nr:tail fiber assembly protein [Enterobacter kobei]OLR18421.1 phage tail protein [Enterobacter kobei]BCU54058.1 hypothetical protein ENKO_06520 [Enterobacter kobei]
MYFFSATTSNFYPEILKPDYDKSHTWPDDAIQVSEDIYLEYSAMPPDGKERGADKHGYPAWVNLAPPTPEQLKATAEKKKLQLRATADQEIEWRQDAVDERIASDDEIADLAAWKKYRVLLMRVDTTSLDWPEPPK